MKEYVLIKQYDDPRSYDSEEPEVVKAGDKEAILKALVKDFFNEFFNYVSDKAHYCDDWSINGKKISSERSVIREYNLRGVLEFDADGERVIIDRNKWSEPTLTTGDLWSFSCGYECDFVVWHVRSLT